MNMPILIRLTCGALLLLGVMGLGLTGLGSMWPAAAEEDATRCECWYGGYDDYEANGGGRSFCDEPPPGTMLDDCELIHTPQTPAKEWWKDGCLTAVDGGKRKCPYKA